MPLSVECCRGCQQADVHLICTKRPNIDNNNLKMNFGNLLYIQPNNVQRNMRNIETTEKKLVNAKKQLYLIILV